MLQDKQGVQCLIFFTTGSMTPYPLLLDFLPSKIAPAAPLLFLPHCSNISSIYLLNLWQLLIFQLYGFIAFMVYRHTIISYATCYNWTISHHHAIKFSNYGAFQDLPFLSQRIVSIAIRMLSQRHLDYLALWIYISMGITQLTAVCIWEFQLMEDMWKVFVVFIRCLFYMYVISYQV